MTVSNYQARRATIDDLVVLRRLWQQSLTSSTDLEKRLTEFQIVETPEGEVLGAIGLQVRDQQGRIHSEVYRSAELATELRPRLWARIQNLARNQGLVRLWLEGPGSMFWLDQGFEAAGSQALKKLPEDFDAPADRQWLMLALREEGTARSIEQELAIFRQFQQAQGERLTRQVRVMRLFAGLVVAIVLGLVACAGWYILTHSHQRPRG
ncbi:MAG: hypothetical protein U1G07_12225 [Verrucomicrobiota bacterium]